MTGIKNALLHLRLNYNFFILSAPFFLGAIFVSHVENLSIFIGAFLLIYIFLFGGANIYNSYFDKDAGPIGGLEHPPKVERWMYYTSWALQIIGLIIATTVSSRFGLVFLFSILLFWLYSSPTFRFKGKPLLSFLIIGVGTVFNTTLLGYFMAGGNRFPSQLIISAIGACFLILSMYPVSQAYQIDEDSHRGDVTFAVKYGIKGIKINYLILFPLGTILLSYSFLFEQFLAISSFLIGCIAYVFIWQKVKSISGKQSEYKSIMRLKYFGGVTFTAAMVGLLLLINIT